MRTVTYIDIATFFFSYITPLNRLLMVFSSGKSQSNQTRIDHRTVIVVIYSALSEAH